MTMQNLMNDECILVTGASSEIALATAKLLARRGAHVALVVLRANFGTEKAVENHLPGNHWRPA
jgi:NAD(P)-dependent dehydrogenase (short-subunit alcohol dehydrogenase family)